MTRHQRKAMVARTAILSSSTASAPSAAPQKPLSRKAMLVSLTISRWGNRKLDEAITAQVQKQHGTADEIGRYTKLLLPKESLETIGSLIAKARVHYFTETLPWLDEGWRLLPSKNHMAFSHKLRTLADEYEIAAQDLARHLPTHIAEAKRRLNGLFNPADYPQAADLARRYKMTISYRPFPDEEDIRVEGISDEDIATIRAEITADVRQGMADATRDLWTRVHETVAHMRERLAAYSVDANGKVEHPFRDSVVGNLQSIVDLLPRLNVDDDPALTNMHRQLVKTLAAETPAGLRADPAKRKASIADADALLASMADYVGDNVK